MKIQKAIWKETVNIAIGVAALSVMMQLVFLLLNKWDWPVLWGNLLGGIYAVLNFFILGLTVQKVASYGDEKRSKNMMQFSYSCRMLGTMLVVFLGISVPMFNWIAAFLPQLFPRITIFFMGVTGKHSKEALKEETRKAKNRAAGKVVEEAPSQPEDAEVAAALAEAEALEAEAKAAQARANAAKAKAAAARAAADKASADKAE